MEKEILVKDFCDKYGFEMKAKGGVISIVVLNTDGNSCNWINYDINKDSIYITGNTDSCNLWFCDTRKDLTPEKCVNLVSDLNNIFETEILIRELIDPEDWQEIARISDADLDKRYNS